MSRESERAKRNAGSTVDDVPLKPGEVIDEETGEVTMIADEAFGDVASVVKDGEGYIVRAYKLTAGKSLTGDFLGFSPFEYEDKEDKGRSDAVDGKIVLSWVMLDLKHPVTKKPLGIVAKIMGTTRILGDLASASPGDQVSIARLGQIEVGKRRMWDDVVRIKPHDVNASRPMLSSKPITTHKDLASFRSKGELSLPGMSATTPTLTSADVDAEEIRKNDSRQ